jgi:hypothetical protein
MLLCARSVKTERKTENKMGLCPLQRSVLPDVLEMRGQNGPSVGPLKVSNKLQYTTSKSTIGTNSISPVLLFHNDTIVTVKKLNLV